MRQPLGLELVLHSWYLGLHLSHTHTDETEARSSILKHEMESESRHITNTTKQAHFHTFTLVTIYFVFDVQYPRELANTCNFLDACVGRIDKKLKIRPCVQRKMNILLAELDIIRT